MPKGDKSAYTDKQKRKAEHIEQAYEKRGLSEGEAARRAWATVNKQDKGGNKRGHGRGAAKKSKAAARRAGARRAAQTRRRRGTGGRKARRAP